MVGGLILNHALTICTTPVVKIYLGKFGDFVGRLRRGEQIHRRIGAAPRAGQVDRETGKSEQFLADVPKPRRLLENVS